MDQQVAGCPEPNRIKIDIMTNIEQRFEICANMDKYGGSFVKQLANLIRIADHTNMQLIEDTWMRYLEQYHPSKWPQNK